MNAMIQALLRPMWCSVFSDGDDPTESSPKQYSPYVDERLEFKRRLDDLERRTRYIEERLRIVRRETEDNRRGLET